MSRGSSKRSSRARRCRAGRQDLERLSGQGKYPVIEFDDGSVYREESADMAARIRAGTLFEADGGTAAP